MDFYTCVYTYIVRMQNSLEGSLLHVAPGGMELVFKFSGSPVLASSNSSALSDSKKDVIS